MTRKSLWLLICSALLVFIGCQKAPQLTITSPPTVDMSVDGSRGTITFTANRDWTISTSDSWITVSPKSGEASKDPVSVTVSCNANTTYEDRTATVTIRMEELTQTVTIKQPANLGIILPTKSFNLESGSNSFNVEVQANVPYSVSSSVDWIKQTGTKALTSTTYVFSVEENASYDDREGTVTIKSQNSSVPDQVITVRQAQKDALIVKDKSFDMPYGGGEIEFKVEANVDFDVTPSEDWIHHVETKALSSSTVRLTIDENPTYSKREGKIEIKQKNGSLSHTITVKQAERIAVTSITLDQTSLTLKPEETATLVATVKPDNATDKTVTWSSSDPDIAAVDDNGKVNATKIGSAKITARAGEKTAECSVSVCIPITSIELNLTSLKIKEGETVTLTATVMPDNATDKTVNWSSSDTSVATVDQSGKVTALKEGSTTITAKAGEKTARCSINVEDLANEIITFADPAAKYACVSKYDTNGDGEVSVAEAEAATSFAGLFDDWRGVASFDEIRYFKNVHSLNGVFQECNKLVSITIPDNITSLGTAAFYGCFSLESVTLPSGITSIGAFSFYECKSLTSIDIPANVTSIEGYAFMGCYQLKEITIPIKTTTLGEAAFYQCSSLSSVVFLGNHITAIPNSCFYRCQSLASITIPDGVVSIGDNAFEGVAMWKMVVPSSVTSIGNHNFTGIKNVLLLSKSYVSIENRTFGSGVIYVPADMLDTYKIRTNWAYYSLSLYPLEAYKDKTEYTFKKEGAVDMGLSVKWAAYNIGATKPEEYGEYYAWGEIETKTDFSWETYFDNPSGDGKTFIKYYFGDGGKTNLDLEDDVAHVKWGEKWRMPSAFEMEELIHGCIWEWTEYNNVTGCMVYGIGSGNIIFIPEAGSYNGTYNNDRNTHIDLWSSSLDEINGSTYAINGGTYRPLQNLGVGAGYRSSGQSVRPVSE